MTTKVNQANIRGDRKVRFKIDLPPRFVSSGHGRSLYVLNINLYKPLLARRSPRVQNEGGYDA
jgi:hypothetical protein